MSIAISKYLHGADCKLALVDYKTLISENLRRVRAGRPEISNNELARVSGLAANTIGNIEKGKVSPRWANLEQIAKALRVPAHTLVIPEDEGKLLAAYHAASPEDRELLLQTAALIVRKSENQ